MQKQKIRIPSKFLIKFVHKRKKLWSEYKFDGFAWQGYINTSLKGGDPSVVKTGITNYLAVYVGEPYSVGIQKNAIPEGQKQVFPNPFTRTINVIPDTGNEFYELNNSIGHAIWTGKQIEQQNFSDLPPDLYFLKVKNKTSYQMIKLIKSWEIRVRYYD